MAKVDEVVDNPQSLDDPRRTLLSRVAASASFAKAARLRELLLYLAECSLRTPQTSLTEQQIGIAVFNRLPGYDTAADTIVRVQVSEVRKRLKYFFASEGIREPIVIELPRGSYVLNFYRREALQGIRTEVTAPPQNEARNDEIVTAYPETRESEPREPKLAPIDESRNVAPARSALVPWLASLLGVAVLLCGWLAYQNVQLRKQPLAELSRGHSLHVLPGKCVSTAAGKGWTNTPFPVQTRIFTASFDATPGAAARINDVVAISDGAQSQISRFSILIAFSETGYILARNGNNYTAVNAIRYSSSTSYHFRLVIDVPARTYSVYVTPPGSTEIPVGTNFAFRAEASDIKSLNSIGSLVESQSGAITFCNFDLN